MKKLLVYILFVVISGFSLVRAQELNMKVTVNSNQIQTTDKSVFTKIEEVLNQLVNDRKWTDATFASNELIEGSILITLSEIPQENSYKGEIQIIANRPVYNATYNTPIFNFRDTEFEFSYLLGENLEYIESNVNNNLVAVIAYYTYIVLGLDFDSFALQGGKPYFEKAMEIVNAAQSLNAKGWAPFGGDRNRYAIALALTEESSSVFHSMWYNFHRKGLDEMAANPSRGRAGVIATVPDLQTIYKARPASAILSFYGDTKLDELINIYSEATTEEKAEAYKILQSIFPTKRYILDKIKK
ncbi:uncharacterized protein DUF4835 [Dysgonomonas alginatilytica]|uniref:Uncharacterized protein DUF4835 n=1 Tax=Dysgonomonas alginatilytica TaxID=1605892 RepID=A0A2V3PNZ2_9BACT|nr:DUF4835 family protein [Dysgonomonas alginatilytica]PXV64699.1 uncharacterized protein DUF4835 [Dysgonomonas alginatilytica]